VSKEMSRSFIHSLRLFFVVDKYANAHKRIQ